jgi:hypothetical protein
MVPNKKQNLGFYTAASFSDSPTCGFMNGDKDLSSILCLFGAVFQDARTVPT